MSKQHGWAHANASRALMEFNLRKPSISSISEQEINPAKTKLTLCRICTKPVKRIGNHLRQTHKLPNYRASVIIKKCPPAVENLVESSNSDSSDSDFISEDSDNGFETLFMSDIHTRGNQMMEPCTDEEDDDCLGHQYSIARGYITESDTTVPACDNQDNENVDSQNDNEEDDLQNSQDINHGKYIENNKDDEEDDDDDIDFEDMDESL